MVLGVDHLKLELGCSEENIDKTKVKESRKFIETSYVVTINDLPNVTQLETLQESGVAAEQHERTFGCVKKRSL